MTKRFRFQFSLRTLVVATLTIGSGALLWIHWMPFAVSFSIDEPNVIQDVFFSDDERFVIFRYDELGTSSNFLTVLDVRESATGQRHALLKIPAHDFVGAYIVGDFVKIYSWVDFASHDELRNPPTLVNYVKGRLVERDDWSKGTKSRLTLGTQYSVIEHGNEITALSLPDFAPVKSIANARKYDLVKNKLFIDAAGVLEMHDLTKQSAVVIGKLDPFVLKFVFLEEQTLVVALSAARLSRTVDQVRVYDLKSHSLILDLPSHGVHCLSRDGRTIVIGTPHKMNAYELSNGKAVEVKALNGDYLLQFSDDDTLCFSPDHCRMFDGRTFEKLWEVEDSRIATRMAGGAMVAVQYETHEFNLIDARTGGKIARLSNRLAEPGPNTAAFIPAPHTSKFVINYHPPNQFGGTQSKQFPYPTQHAELYELRRPWQWYGPAYLWEFWLFVLLCSTFLYGVVKDRRIRKL